MTFQEALESLRDPDGNASPEGLALAEQVEANRVAIQEVLLELNQPPETDRRPWTPPKLELHGNRVAVVRDSFGRAMREDQ